MINLLLATMLSSANINVSEQFKYYNIYGNSVAELRKSIVNQRPNMPHLGNFDAYTDWQIQFGYSLKKSHGRCQIVKPKIYSKITFTLPKWKTENPANKALFREWHRYKRALIEHENGHKMIALEAADAIEKMLNDMPRSSTCSHLQRLADKQSAQITNKYKAKQRQFDADTNHGINTGAVLGHH